MLDAGSRCAAALGKRVLFLSDITGWLADIGLSWERIGVDFQSAEYEIELQMIGMYLAVYQMWEEERDGPDEVFTLATDILAVDGQTTVVRAEVCYGGPPRQEYRDLWVIRLTDDGRCTWFEEWPYWPESGHSARDDLA